MEIFYGNREASGGYLDVDMNVNGESMEPVENVFFGDAEKGVEAQRGQYRVSISG